MNFHYCSKQINQDYIKGVKFKEVVIMAQEKTPTDTKVEEKNDVVIDSKRVEKIISTFDLNDLPTLEKFLKHPDHFLTKEEYKRIFDENDLPTIEKIQRIPDLDLKTFKKILNIHPLIQERMVISETTLDFEQVEIFTTSDPNSLQPISQAAATAALAARMSTVQEEKLERIGEVDEAYGLDEEKEEPSASVPITVSVGTQTSSPDFELGPVKVSEETQTTLPSPVQPFESSASSSSEPAYTSASDPTIKSLATQIQPSRTHPTVLIHDPRIIPLPRPSSVSHSSASAWPSSALRSSSSARPSSVSAHPSVLISAPFPSCTSPSELIINKMKLEKHPQNPDRLVPLHSTASAAYAPATSVASSAADHERPISENKNQLSSYKLPKLMAVPFSSPLSKDRNLFPPIDPNNKNISLHHNPTRDSKNKDRGHSESKNSPFTR